MGKRRKPASSEQRTGVSWGGHPVLLGGEAGSQVPGDKKLQLHAAQGSLLEKRPWVWELDVLVVLGRLQVALTPRLFNMYSSLPVFGM